jgi:hypothetical protein
MPVFGVGVELDVWGEGRGWLRISDRSRYDPSSCLGSNWFDCGERWILFWTGRVSPYYVVSCRVVLCCVVLRDVT